ncbi:MAG: nucleotidyltransferase domain-containing protein, partial [Syntrophales bacterium]|nr:nucleotidyltransferase domain-containing protein [Syntrophales bacterium]
MFQNLSAFFQREAGKFKITAAFVYGSWARGTPRADSDVDIALLFAEEADDEDTFRHLTALTVALSDPPGRDAILIVIHLDFRHPMLYYNA